jgi:hypothetical protein
MYSKRDLDKKEICGNTLDGKRKGGCGKEFARRDMRGSAEQGRWLCVHDWEDETGMAAPPSLPNQTPMAAK